jgi:hypothetical protein
MKIELKDDAGNVLKTVEVPVAEVANAFRDEVVKTSQVMATASLLDYADQLLKPIAYVVVSTIGQEVNRRKKRQTLPLTQKPRRRK